MVITALALFDITAQPHRSPAPRCPTPRSSASARKRR